MVEAGMQYKEIAGRWEDSQPRDQLQIYPEVDDHVSQLSEKTSTSGRHIFVIAFLAPRTQQETSLTLLGGFRLKLYGIAYGVMASEHKYEMK